SIGLAFSYVGVLAARGMSRAADAADENAILHLMFEKPGADNKIIDAASIKNHAKFNRVLALMKDSSTLADRTQAEEAFIQKLEKSPEDKVLLKNIGDKLEA